MNYVVYNQATGEIVQEGTCPPSAMGRQATGRFGYACAEGKGNGLEHVVVDGKVVPRPAEEIAARRAALDAAMALPPGVVSEADLIVEAFAHMKARGADLGAAGEALVARHAARTGRGRGKTAL